MPGQLLAITRGPRAAVIATRLIEALDRQLTEAALPVKGQPELVVGLPEPAPEAVMRETGKRQTLA
jgi:hypothetical protein